MDIREMVKKLEKELDAKIIEMIGETNEYYVFLTEEYVGADPAVTIYPAINKKTGECEEWDLDDWSNNDVRLIDPIPIN